jgi:hypothetical protein
MPLYKAVQLHVNVPSLFSEHVPPFLQGLASQGVTRDKMKKVTQYSILWSNYPLILNSIRLRHCKVYTRVAAVLWYYFSMGVNREPRHVAKEGAAPTHKEWICRPKQHAHFPSVTYFLSSFDNSDDRTPTTTKPRPFCRQKLSEAYIRPSLSVEGGRGFSLLIRPFSKWNWQYWFRFNREGGGGTVDTCPPCQHAIVYLNCGN